MVADLDDRLDDLESVSARGRRSTAWSSTARSSPAKSSTRRTTLFGVADVRQMWLTLDVRQEDAKYLSLGQTVLFRAER